VSRTARLAWLGVAVLVLIVAFVLLRPSDDDKQTTADTPTTTATAAATDTATPVAGETSTPTPSPSPKPTVDPGPILTGNSVRKLRFEKGDTVRFRVRVPEDHEIHIHGYDIAKNAKANQILKVSFKATIDGIFEIELEDTGQQIAELRVDP
jgi:hypothetical protein